VLAFVMLRNNEWFRLMAERQSLRARIGLIHGRGDVAHQQGDHLCVSGGCPRGRSPTRRFPVHETLPSSYSQTYAPLKCPRSHRQMSSHP
jgi:hypothetical protein